MDIFTTQLARVIQIPIKPANLKVKALLKDAAAGKLKEDLDHLENHDYYFGEKKSDQEMDDEQKSKQENQQKNKVAVKSDESVESELSHNAQLNDQEEGIAEVQDGITESKDGTKHLDIYI